MDYRPTRAIIDLKAIRENTEKIIAEYNDYEYKIGVIKANCYGFGSEKVIPALIEGGINYLAVSCVKEALEAKRICGGKIPIMILVPCEVAAYPLCAREGIAVSVATLSQAKQVCDIPELKVFIRANGGRDLFGGPTQREAFEEIFDILCGGSCVLEGIFMHCYNPEDISVTSREYDTFESCIGGIDLSKVKIISTSNSLSLPIYEKKPYCNAFRIGNMLYGIENTNLGLSETFKLVSEVKQIITLRRGQSISYCGYCARREGERIALIPIGYGDGFSKANEGRDIFINKQRCKIITVTMDITLADIGIEEGEVPSQSEKNPSGDMGAAMPSEVILIAGNRHLDEIAKHTGGVAEEAICALNGRVKREYTL
ncbi:MAG: hypothetical protein GX061_04450 [Eubacteriaceae bacterium]|nr:hypothetical protein [Eubacteriaceae bacterium]